MGGPGDGANLGAPGAGGERRADDIPKGYQGIRLKAGVDQEIARGIAVGLRGYRRYADGQQDPPLA